MRFLIIFILLFAHISILNSKTIYLKTAAQDSPPKYFIKNNKMTGLCVDIIKEIEKIDPDIKIIGYKKFLPFKRIQLYLKKGFLNIFVGFAKDKYREKFYNYVNIPLYSVNLIFAARKDDNISNLKLNDINDFCGKGKIITVAGTHIDRLLKNYKNLMIDDSAPNLETALKMLVFKRGRFVFYHDLGLIYTIKQNKNIQSFLKKIFSIHCSFQKCSSLCKRKIEK